MFSWTRASEICVCFMTTLGGINLTLQAQPELLECESIDVIVDEQVVELAKKGDATALEHLINKYKNFVRAKAR